MSDQQPQQSTETPEWQAIWSPQHSAYYFYNSISKETTWVNPLQPPEQASEPQPEEEPQPEAGPEVSQTISPTTALQQAAIAQGIDPSLAYLDPSLVAASSSSASSSSIPAGTFTAKFNARTGQFTRPDARDPTHLSEYDRAKRMSAFYFDVNAWEQDVAVRKEQEAVEEAEIAAGIRKKKRPSKKDLERFKEQKKLKKIAKTAWLRT